MAALLRMLAPDVVILGDGGGKAKRAGRPPAGAEHVARHMASLFRRARVLGVSLHSAWVNGEPGAVACDVGVSVVAVFALDVADGAVQSIRAVVNPDKLRRRGLVSDLARARMRR